MRGQRRDIAMVQCLGIAALCLVALAPAAAVAATANTRIKRVFYTADPGEVNNLTISLAGADYVLADPGATITAAPACVGMGSSVTCPTTAIIGITVSAGDGADSITNTTATRSTLSGGDGNDSLAGGSGNDILRGNKGVDTHAGGAGDDLIDARGDRGDVVSCGDGNDTVLADAADSIALDCETVDRGVLPPPPPPGAASAVPVGRGPSRPGRDAHAWPPAPARATWSARLRTTAWSALTSATTCWACRETTSSRGSRETTASSAASDPTACPARRATTACSATTARRA